MKTTLLLAFSLITVLVGSALPDDLALRASPESKSASDYFPHRVDLIRDVDFAKDPTVVPPQPVSQPSAALPKNILGGTYQLQIAFIIEKDGRVKEAAIMESSGVPALDASYLKAIKKWKFRPMEYQGRKIPCASRQPVRIEL